MRANLESRERCAAKHYGHIIFLLAVGHFFVKKKKKRLDSPNRKTFWVQSEHKVSLDAPK